MDKDFRPIEKEDAPPELKEVDQDRTLVTPASDTGPTKAISRTDDTLLGSTLGGTIVIHELLGKGGMSTVYKGWQTQIERAVAVKVMHSHLMEEKHSLLRFQKEARAVGKLDHPNIVKVNDFRAGETGLSYLVMDYVEGKDLQELIKEEGPMDTERAVSIFSQALDAFEHAHRNGVIHRDIKPSNLMIVKDGEEERVKILDFGIAKVVQDELTRDQRLTKTGEVFGSPLYMSPEQCMGKELDHRSDIYSMGCLIYEALTSMPPLEGANVFETFFKHTTEMPEPLTNLRKDLKEARELDAIILKAMAKEPDKRYQSMQDLKYDLEDLLGERRSRGIITRARGEVEYIKRRESAKKSSRATLLAASALILSIAIMCYSFAITTPKADSSKSWREAYTDGQKSFDQGKYEDAQKKLTSALDKATRDKDRSRIIPSLVELIDLNRAQGKIYDDSREKMLNRYRKEITDEIFKSLTGLEKEMGTLKEPEKIEKTIHSINEQAVMVAERYPGERQKLIPLLEEALKTIEKTGLKNTRADNRTIHNLGFIAYLDNDYQKAQNMLDKALVQGRALYEKQPGTVSTYLNTLDTYFHVLWSQQKLKKAEELLQERLEISEQLRNNDKLGKSESNGYIAKSKQKLAAFYLYTGKDPAKAEDLALASQLQYENMEEPPVAQRAENLALLGKIKLIQNEPVEAKEYFLGAMDLFESLKNQDSPYFVESLISLGDLHMAKNEADRAEPYYRRAAVVGLRQVPQFRQAVENSLKKLKKLIYERNQTEIASTRIENPRVYEQLESLENLKLISDQQLHGKNSSYAGADYLELYKLARHKGDLVQADNFLKEAGEIYSHKEDSSAISLEILVDRANLAFDRKENSKARGILQEGMALLERESDILSKRPDIVKKLVFSLEHRLKDKKLSDKAMGILERE